MADISVKTDKMISAADLFDSQAKRLEQMAQSISDVKGQISLEGSSGANVKSAVGKAGEKTRKNAKDMLKMASTLREIAKLYRSTENKIIGSGNKSGRNGPGGSGGGGGGTSSQNGRNKGSSKYSTDPVNLNTGNFVLDNQDLEIPGAEPLVFNRFYNSMGIFGGMLGYDWSTSFDKRLDLNPVINVSGSDVCVLLEDGKEERFILKKGKNYIPDSATTAELKKTDEGFVYTSLDGDSSIYDQKGKFIRYENSHHVGYDLEYDIDEVLICVKKDSGEFFKLTYDEDGRLIQVEDHAGRICRYSYEGGHLAKVVLPDQGEFSYSYTENGKLSGVKNPRNFGVVEIKYDHSFRVVFQKFADGTTNEFEYRDDDKSVIMTERNGVKSIHYHDEEYQNVRNVYSDGEESFEYNDRGQKTKITDKAGNVYLFKYDNRGNIAGFIQPDGTKWSATYNAQNRLITVSVNGEQKVHNTYNEHGDLICRADGLGRKTGYSYNEMGQITRITLADGSFLNASYDDSGNLIQVGTMDGGVYRYAYDILNRPVEYTDALGNKTQFKYDPCGRLREELRADGTSRIYKYDLAGNTISFTDYDGSTVRTDYNANNKPVAHYDALGRKTEYEYDPMWNVSKVLSPGGAVVSYFYNKENLLERVRDAEGNETHFTYDVLGNLLTETDPEGNMTAYAWDANGRCIKKTAPDGAVTQFGYDAEDHEIYRKDAEGIELFRCFDAAGQLVKEQDSLGQIKTYSYDDLGRMICEIDEKGHKTMYQYAPGSDQVTEILHPDGTSEKYSYDLNRNLISHINPFGIEHTYEYDSLNRKTAVSDDLGKIMSYTYDPMDRILSETDCEGNVTRYDYLATGQLAAVISPLGSVTKYRYDESDQLLEIIRDDTSQGESVHICYERNKLGQITKLVDALGNVESYKYDGNGRMTCKTDREGNDILYSYYPTGMLKSVEWANGKRASYSYTSLQKLKEIRDWTGNTTIDYDPLGNVTRIRYPDDREALFAYDQHFNQILAKYPDGKEVSYTYDPLDRMTGVQCGDLTVGYEYNKTGQIRSRSFSDNNVVNYDYNPQGLISGMKHTDAHGTANELSFGYDRYGRRDTFELYRRDLPQDNGQYRYTYDLDGQISSVFKGDQLIRNYSYDSLNRRSSMQYRDPATGLLEKAEFKYNKCGAPISLTRPGFSEEYRYDRRGNLVSLIHDGRLTTEYTYDALNRITAVANADGRRAEYEYNGLGYRVGMRTTEGGKETETIYTLDYSRIYDNMLEKNTVGVDHENYIWGAGLEGYQADQNRCGWYLTDPLGSVLLRTDPDGVGYAANYDEFGNKTSGKGSDIFGYNGFLVDPMAGTYYAQARQYRSYTGTFDAMDRFGGDITMPSTINPYVYCVYNPFVHTDKSAYYCLWDDLIAAGLGAAIGMGGQLVADLIEGAATGKWDFRWQEYVGAGIGGAAGGVATLYAGPIVGGAVSSGVTKASTEGLNYVSDPNGYTKSFGDVAKEVAVETAMGAAAGIVAEGAGKVISKISSTKFVSNIASGLKSKGKLGQVIAERLSDLASGKEHNLWKQAYKIYSNTSDIIFKSEKLKVAWGNFFIKHLPKFLGWEILKSGISKLKPAKILYNMLKDKVKDWLGFGDKRVACYAGSW